MTTVGSIFDFIPTTRNSTRRSSSRIPVSQRSTPTTKLERPTPMATNVGDQGPYDRAAEINRFEHLKLGVKGLVDSGLRSIPRFFIHPPDTLSSLRPGRPGLDLIPTIDLSGVDSHQRPEIVERVSRACRELGFFQIINHGVPVEVLDRTIGAVRAFHEGSPEEKAKIYRREMKTGVSFFSNVDLFQSKAASWR